MQMKCATGETGQVRQHATGENTVAHRQLASSVIRIIIYFASAVLSFFVTVWSNGLIASSLFNFYVSYAAANL